MAFRKRKSLLELRYDESRRGCRHFTLLVVQPKGWFRFLFGKIAGISSSFCSDLLRRHSSQFCQLLYRKENSGERSHACFLMLPYDQKTTCNFSHDISSGWHTCSAGYDCADCRCRDYFHRAAELNLGYNIVQLTEAICRRLAAGDHPPFADNCRTQTTNFMQDFYPAPNYAVLQMETTCGAFGLLWKKTAKERFIAATGVISWLTSFAPKGMAGGNRFYFPEKHQFLI